MDDSPRETLKIATWNIMKPARSSMRNANILAEVERVKADIWILTETNDCISPGPHYKPFSTVDLSGTSSTRCHSYKNGERSVTIWSKYYDNAVIKTVDSPSSVCVCLDTPLRQLDVYGTIIGVHGRGGEEFNRDLETQPRDWQRLSQAGRLCIAGDFNTSLTGNYYVSKVGRAAINGCFESENIQVPTRDIPDNIDHICLSTALLNGLNPTWETWNKAKDKKQFSDHMGVGLRLERRFTQTVL